MSDDEQLTYSQVFMSLRAPRVAVLIPRDQWTTFARSALGALSRLWGGVGGVVVPVGPSGAVNPVVLAALREFDPDYIAPLRVSAPEFELAFPGRMNLRDDRGRRILSADRRRNFLEQHSEFISLGPLIGLDDVGAVGKTLNTFQDDGRGRVHAVSRDAGSSRPLSPVPDTDRQLWSFVGTTGYALADLALGARYGLDADAGIKIDMGNVSPFTLWSREMRADWQESAIDPFARTAEHLEMVQQGYRERHAPAVVLGDSADDFALAMILDRTQGDVVWLPRMTNVRHKHLSAIGEMLHLAQLSSHEPLIVTSLSLNEGEVGARLARFWQMRAFRLVPDTSLAWTFVDATSMASSELWKTYCVPRMWSLIRSMPTRGSTDGASEMLTPPPIEWPEELEALDLRWIVQVDRFDRRLPLRCPPRASLLTADLQNPRETFVRASRGGIAYERGRWDFVAAGAPIAGRAAAPLLRWPSLEDQLRARAADYGHDVRLSDSGRRARVVTSLWDSPSACASELVGHGRRILELLIPPTRDNGSRDNGPYVRHEASAICRYGRGHATFAEMCRAIGTEWETQAVRVWVDGMVDRGVLRRGLLLGCGSCSSVDFYPIELVAARNRCPRCGTSNALQQSRWRIPADEPQWFYDVHQAVDDLLTQHGDLPLIAWERYASQGRGPRQQWFEFELVDASGKPIVEFDFVGLEGTRLVLGEAKSSKQLDGKSVREKRRDVTKMFSGAALLGADELCLATVGDWATASMDAVHDVARASADSISVTVLERITDSSASKRRVVVHGV